MEHKLAEFIHETYLEYMKDEGSIGIPFQNYLAQKLINNGYCAKQ